MELSYKNLKDKPETFLAFTGLRRGRTPDRGSGREAAMCVHKGR